MRMSASRYLQLGDSLGWMRFLSSLASYYSRNGFLANPGFPVLWEAHDIIYRSSQQAMGLPPLPGWGWGRLGSSCSSGLHFTDCELLPVAEPPPQRCAKDPGTGTVRGQSAVPRNLGPPEREPAAPKFPS